MTQFLDHFSSLAKSYAAYRPSYPDALFKWLATQVPAKQLAWDCACGNGQAALKLTDYFDEIIATDASEAQIAQAMPHRKITYRVALAEQSGLNESSVDLVTVAQGLHWFKLAAFCDEAKRVLKPGGILAAWTYDLLSCTDIKLMQVLNPFFRQIETYWPPQRIHVRNAYRDLPIPFTVELSPPSFALKTDWTLEQLTGYFRSWSSVKYFKEKNGVDPVDDLEKKLKEVWENPDQTVIFDFPIYLRAGRL